MHQAQAVTAAIAIVIVITAIVITIIIIMKVLTASIIVLDSKPVEKRTKEDTIKWNPVSRQGSIF